MNSSNRLPTKWNPLKIADFVKTEVAAHSIQIDDVNGDGTLMYIGEAACGTTTSTAGWQIRKVLKTGTVTAFTYANGNGDFINIWDNRVSLVYS